MFDSGELKQDSDGAHAEMGRLLEAMMHPETYDRNTKPTSALVQIHNSIWFRVLEVKLNAQEDSPTLTLPQRSSKGFHKEAPKSLQENLTNL